MELATWAQWWIRKMAATQVSSASEAHMLKNAPYMFRSFVLVPRSIANDILR